jgi:uncharacterized protein YkwD
MEYKIVSHKDAQDTQDEVNAFLKEGWELHGDLKVTDSLFTQAMKKRGDYDDSNDFNVYLPNQESLEDAIRSIGGNIEDALTNVARALTPSD